MRLMANKISFLFLILFCLFSFACGQTEAEKIKVHNQYVDKATVLRKQGDLQGAIEQQKKAVELFPNNADTLAVLAGMYINLHEENSSLENLEKAKELLLKASSIKPRDSVIHIMLAGVFDMMGNEKEALEHNKIAANLEPNNLQNLTNLGSAQNGVGNNDAARATFEKVLRKNPNYAYALYQYAELELETGNREKAIELFERGSKASATDNDDDTKYIEISRNRLEELRNEKVKTAFPK